MNKLEGKVALGTGASRGIGAAIAEPIADFVAFGRPYIANPDLVERLATGAPLAEVDWRTVYASGPRGYTDYPTYQPQDNHESGPAKDNTSRRLSKP